MTGAGAEGAAAPSAPARFTAMPPLQVDLIALLPEGWELCSTCQAFIDRAGLAERDEMQARESLPPELRLEAQQLADLVMELAACYGERIQIRIYDPRSIQGLALAIRHRVRSYPTFLVAGAQKVKGLDRVALEEALANAGVQPNRSG
jgi:hypothetical protein